MLHRLGLLQVCILFAGSLSAQTTFTSSGGFTLGNTLQASPYPTASNCVSAACINVSGVTGTITDVRVVLTTTTSTSFANLAFLLESPGGGKFDFLSNACLSSGTHTVTFSDAAALRAGSGTSCLATGSWLPSANDCGVACIDDFPSPGPGTNGYTKAGPAGTGTFGNVFAVSPVNQTPNGVWKLYVINRAQSGVTGSIAGWSLILTASGLGAATTTTITTTSPNPVALGANTTVTAQVSSASTVTAGNVQFNDATTGLTLGTVPVNASGIASLSAVQFATEGVHLLRATYLGGVGFGASSPSPSYVHTVFKATTAQSSPPPGTVGFCNTGGVTLPSVNALDQQGPGTPFPSYITVSGVSGIIQSMRVYLNGYTSSAPQGTGYMLRGPNGKSLEFTAWVGGSTTVSNQNLIFDDAAAASAQPNVSFASGSYKPTVGVQFADSRYCQSMTAANCNNIQVSEPAPNPFEQAGPNASPARTLTSQFLGSSANGTWKLFSDMRQNPFAAAITSWCVNFTMGNGTATTSSVVASPNPAISGNAITFTATVTAGATPINEGTVTFTDDTTGNNIGPATAVINGVATLSGITNLIEGTHSITAVYSGTANFGASSAATSLRIDNPTVVTNVGGAFKYCNQASTIAIPGLGQLTGAAYPYPSNISVSNLPGTVKTVELDLNSFTSSSPQGFQALIVAPCQSGSCALDVFSNPQGTASVNALNLLFFDAAANTIPAGTLTSGSYRPYSGLVSNTYTSPAPSVFSRSAPAGAQTLNGQFAGTNGNGLWSLYLTSNVSQANATSVGNWCLLVTNNPPVLSASKSGPTTVSQGQTGIAYSISVTNNGPGATAGQVSVSETPGTGMTVTAMSGTNWTCTQPAGPCTRNDALAANASYEPISVTVSMAADAPTGTAASSNRATVSGGGSASAANSNTLSVNVNPTPGSMVLSGGSPQSAVVNTPFAIALSVLVRDGASNPASGTTVTFTAPAAGASGTFSNSQAAINVVTNASGIASAPFTANAVAGAYTVTATSGALPAVDFSLTNTGEGSAAIAALITGKTGIASARVWTLTVSNYGTGSAVNTQITGFTLTQTSGTACTPVISTAMPVSLGSIAPASSAAGNLTIDFSGCAALARFTAQANLTANSGAAIGTMTLANQLR